MRSGLSPFEGAKHFPQDALNQMLLDADFPPLKDKEIAFYYGPQ
jgi:hypothetical protein